MASITWAPCTVSSLKTLEKGWLYLFIGDYTIECETDDGLIFQVQCNCLTLKFIGLVESRASFVVVSDTHNGLVITLPENIVCENLHKEIRK